MVFSASVTFMRASISDLVKIDFESNEIHDLVTLQYMNRHLMLENFDNISSVRHMIKLNCEDLPHNSDEFINVQLAAIYILIGQCKV